MINIGLIALAVIGVDQYTKYLAVKMLSAGASIPVIPPYVYFTLVYNKGISFGLFSDSPHVIFILIGIGVVLIVVLIMQLKNASALMRCAYGLLLGGALGNNAIDRVRIGAVIDFIDVKWWPVFNVADSCITIAAGILIICLLKDYK